jgi:hypothetical protein
MTGGFGIPSCLYGVHIVTRNKYDINAHTVHPEEGKKQNHGDVPKKTSENKLKTNTIIMNSFYNIQYNSEPRAKDNLQFGTKHRIYIQGQENFKWF